ncbi:hypothetical protein [Flagellimonas sp. CMM7]|uniref:hypothetical protein n=1 Tax=Flagellimonas sp. CMM7 TaxID=2654676 RepID=UPI0013D6491A|nr:hypothetical protein [Flagellimonas sp. CMM7]UII81227.1 hypothetical protein LV704_06845 [Flagellimonas sp. CMM7]
MEITRWQKTKYFFGKYLYIILLGYSLLYLIFYSIYYFNSEVNEFLKDYDRYIEYLKSLSLFAFTGGIFTVALKYIQYLKVFEKEFDRIVDSPKFNQKLKATISAITFSEDFLNKQSDLNNIWKKVTLSKYKNEFPELYDKIQKNIENELFQNNSLTKYYKNVQISYELELVEGLQIRVKEYSSFTIIRNNTNSFTWEFFVSFYRDFEEEIESESNLLNVEKTKIDGTEIDIKKCKILNEEENEFFTRKKYSYELKGKKEYHIERCFEFSQNLDEDRIISFSSSHVIDDLSVYIKKGDDLEVVFEPVGKNQFYKNNIFSDARLSYINRDVFLPGEKYKLFVFKT